MSFYVVTEVMRARIGNTHQKFVLLMMADAANDDGAGIWKSISTISEACEISTRTVMRSLQELEEKGLIQRTGSRSVRGGKVTVWDIDLGVLKRFQSPGDTESPSDSQSLNPVTLSHESGDTESHKPIQNLSKEPIHNCSKKFEQAWKLYNSTENKANQVKKTALAAWKRATKKTDPEIILSAIQAEVDARSNSEQWIPALPQMQRWLKEERWESIETTAKPETPENAPRNTGEQTANGQAIYELNGERFYFGASGPTKIKEANHARSNRERDPAMGEVQTPRRAQANMSLL
jgi:hypothetical protein